MSSSLDYYTKKKKTKTKAKPVGNLRIVDDDVTVRELVPENVDNTLEEDIYQTNEPVVVVIDDRPEIEKQLDVYCTGKWKKLAEDIYEEHEAQFSVKTENVEVKQEKMDQQDEDDDLDMIRNRKNIPKGTKKGNDDDLDVIRHKTSANKVNEIDETKVRVKKLTEKELKKKEVEEKKKQQYMEWGKGLVQKKNLEDRVEYEKREMEKPLARYADDVDLDKMLREQEREDDPMLKYIKKSEEYNEDGSKKPSKPRYKGPPAAPNRYGILPGYRWDGVDRSNGFEKRLFESKANKKAVQDEAYKWSVEDM